MSNAPTSKTSVQRFMCIRVLEDGEREINTHFSVVPAIRYDDLLAEIERLRAALMKFGRHDHPSCHDLTLNADGSFGPRNGCLCGFDAATAGISPVETRAAPYSGPILEPDELVECQKRNDELWAAVNRGKYKNVTTAEHDRRWLLGHIRATTALKTSAVQCRQDAAHLLRTARTRINQNDPDNKFWLKLCDEFLAASPQAPIARINVLNDKVAGAIMYAPGLPDGEFDLYCQPEAVAPYMGRAQKATDEYAPVTELTDYPRNNREQP